MPRPASSVRWLAAPLALLALAAVARPVPAAPTLVHRALDFRGAHVELLALPAGARVRPAAHRPGHAVLDWARREGAIAAINGGFFNHSDGYPVSHVVANGRALTRPEANRALLDNPALQPLLPAIWNRRVEWRALSAPGGPLVWAIAPHDAPPAAGETLVHALQAGPALLPASDLAGEGFVKRDARGAIVRDGIGSQAPAARSALGLAADGGMLWVAVAGSDGHGRGLTIAGLADLMRSLGAVSAMALDGGSSTTLVWRDGARWHQFVGTGHGAAAVNSVLLLGP